MVGLSSVGSPTTLSVPLPRHVRNFPNVPQRSESNLTAKLLALAVTVPIFGAFCTVVQLTLFVVGRTVVLPIIFKIPIVSYLLRPFAAHLLRGYTPILFFTQFPTISRAIFLGITTLASWEVSETLFDHVVSEVNSTASIKRTILTAQVLANHCRIFYSRSLCNPYIWHFFGGYVLQAFRIPRVGELVWGSVSRSCRR